MVDGAFTRLYCDWDDAGSARYVSNAACFLAGHAAQQAGEFSGVGAFAGTCDWTHRAGRPWLVMTVGALLDPLVNTDEHTLADPLSVGARNCVVVDAIYEEAMGRLASSVSRPNGGPIRRRVCLCSAACRSSTSLNRATAARSPSCCARA